MAAEDALRQRALGRIGSTLHGKYRIDRLLGVGGMACVFAATHRNGNRVAVKMLHSELTLDEDVRARFLREGYVANRLEHPGAVRVLDDDVAEDGSVFLVMELLEGEPLEAVWERVGRRLPLQDVLRMGLEALDVLAAAHARRVVHRDIKPDNLFVTREQRIKVLDFGIARLCDDGGSATVTRTGRTMGTPAFMPPEQARGRRQEVDARSDVWALGATLFTLVSGRYVHEAETVEEMLICAATQRATPFASVAPGVPAEVAAVVDRALAYAREDRWDSAGPMHAALAKAYATAFGAAPPAMRLSAHSLPSLPSEPHVAMAATQSSDAPTVPASPLVSTTAGVSQGAAPARRAPLTLFVALGATAAIVLVAAFFLRTKGGSARVEGGTKGSSAESAAPAPSPPVAASAAVDTSGVTAVLASPAASSATERPAQPPSSPRSQRPGPGHRSSRLPAPPPTKRSVDPYAP
jgi:eukaryotic-like serine/threonine-protein kinase